MNGWTGRILRVYLDQGLCEVQELDRQLAEKFIGGRGLAVKILYDEGVAKADPLGPDNKLVFGVGPLTATRAVSSGRHIVVTKSPLTGGIAYSNSGGAFGVRMKKSGFDLIIIEGKSPEPVYLDITGQKPVIRPAAHLWGKTTHEAEDIIRAEVAATAIADKKSVACIGPAGEKQVLFASIINDKHRAAGRSGVGTVMGSKNLKAVIVGGDRRVTLADPKAFKESVAVTLELVRQSPALQTLGRQGTPFLVDLVSQCGIHPTNNFSDGIFDGAQKLNAESFHKTIFLRKKACLYCPIGCGRKTQVVIDGRMHEGEGPEYETIALMGASCGVNDLPSITRAGYICNELGLDTISTGGTIACAMELFQMGVISEKDIGYPLKFGDSRALMKMTRQIGMREGFGDVLALGAYRVAERYGHIEVAMTTKKLELPGYDPRGVKEKGLSYATTTRGACHMRSRSLGEELVDALNTEGRAVLLKQGQDYFAVMDSSGVCCLPRGVIKIDLLLPVLKAATGADYTSESLLRAGERIWNVERMFNQEAGLGKDDDSLPERLLKEPLSRGPAAGQVVELEPMLSEYYRVRGWNEDGAVTTEKLAELGLS